MKSKENRMSNLQAAGVDTSKFFNLAIPVDVEPGTTLQVTIGLDGKATVIPGFHGTAVNLNTTEDPVYNQIITDGYVRNTKLHRRFVMAQMFRMLNWEDADGNKGYDAYLRTHYSYMYQFSMMEEELRVLSKLETRDEEAFKERSSFFTKDVVISMYKDYLKKLRQYIDKLNVRHCKGIPYKRIGNVDIFCSDLVKKVYMPVENLIWCIQRAKNYENMYGFVRRFNQYQLIKLPFETPKAYAWKDAFKGAGAYYTLKNMIMFHNVKIGEGVESKNYKFLLFRTFLSTEASLTFIKDRLGKYEGYQYFALLKQTIADNDFDFERSITMSKYNK